MGKVLIGHAHKDERGSGDGYVTGARSYVAKSGDQKGDEVVIENYRQRTKNGSYWCVFRLKDNGASNKVADAMILACKNDNIGYSNKKRVSLYELVKDKGFNPSKADKLCDTDCSACVRVCLAYAGINLESFRTLNMKSTLMSTGLFNLFTDKKFTDNPSNLMRGDILLGSDSVLHGKSGHTAVVVSINGEEGLTSGPSSAYAGPTSYSFPTYKLEDSDLMKLAKIFSSMHSSVIGVKSLASMYANILETDSSYKIKYNNDYMDFVLHSGIIPNVSQLVNTGYFSSNYSEGLKEVLCSGDRVLPLFVNKHDYKSNVVSVKTNNATVTDKSDKKYYIQDATVIKNNYEVSYFFWTFLDNSMDPFGYTDMNLRRQWDMLTSGLTYSGQGMQVQIDYTALKPYIISIDRTTRSTLNLNDLIENHGVIGAMIEAGRGVEYTTFRNPRCYDQVRACIDAGLPFGYTMKSDARSTKDAESEMENLTYILRKYAPKLGMWIELPNYRKFNSKTDEILKVYFKNLVRLGLKNKIGIRCKRDQLEKFTWKEFQEDWYLWLIDPVTDAEEVNQLLDPEFFDTDNESGPVKLSVGNMLTSINVGSGSLANGWPCIIGSMNENAKVIYHIFHRLGMPDTNICGLLGNWQTECQLDPTSVEWNYRFMKADGSFNWGPQHQQVFSSIQSIEAYTKKGFDWYAKTGVKINRKAYIGDDGHYYPGVGFGGLTGPLATRLFTYADKMGAKWYSLEAQMAYITTPRNKGGFGKTEWLFETWQPEASPEAAAVRFFGKWEFGDGRKPKGTYRQENARNWYNKLNELKAGNYEELANAIANYVGSL